MKILATALMIGALSVGLAHAAEEAEKVPEVKTVCVDVQDKEGKPVIDQKTKKPKQSCTKVKIRKKFEGTKIPDGKK